jgi:hypothetical protein
MRLKSSSPFYLESSNPSCRSIHNALYALITSPENSLQRLNNKEDFEPHLFAHNMAAEHHSICEGWPTSFNSSLVWDHEQFPNEDAYIHILSADEKTEINAALKTFKGLSLCD